MLQCAVYICAVVHVDGDEHCRIFDHTVNPNIVLISEKKLFLVVVWLSLSTHL